MWVVVNSTAICFSPPSTQKELAIPISKTIALSMTTVQIKVHLEVNHMHAIYVSCSLEFRGTKPTCKACVLVSTIVRVCSARALQSSYISHKLTATSHPCHGPGHGHRHEYWHMGMGMGMQMGMQMGMGMGAWSCAWAWA